jgi:hypothetical protein
LQNNLSSKTEISLFGIESGIYFVEVISENNIYREKIIIK